MMKIDKEKCTDCGICGIICPRHIPETIGEKDEKNDNSFKGKGGALPGVRSVYICLPK